MTVEGVDSVGVSSEECVGFEPNDMPTWNGRHVEENTNNQTSALIACAFFENLQQNVIQNSLLSKVSPSPSDVVCLKGSAGVSASADTDGNKEVEAHVKTSNEEGNASVEVKGSVSQDSSGNTKGEVTAGLEIDF